MAAPRACLRVASEARALARWDLAWAPAERRPAHQQAARCRRRRAL